jgi:hypothetical protein
VHDDVDMVRALAMLSEGMGQAFFQCALHTARLPVQSLQMKVQQPSQADFCAQDFRCFKHMGDIGERLNQGRR